MDKSNIINEIKLHLNIDTDTEFANFLGIKQPTIASWRKRNSIDYDLIISKCNNIDANWLLTGKGEMLKVEKAAASPVPQPGGIPLVSVTAVGGFGSGTFAIEARDVKAWYTIPKFSGKRVDFMIEVEGSSMYPKYTPGDVVACTIIRESSFIQWNKTHVVATREQGLIIKRIRQGSSKESLCMISDNKDYDPFEVPMSEITGIALVVGVIRLE